jgi:PPOX class probable F420-dependent enzyme
MPKPPLPPEVVALLERPNPAVITAVRADGQPVSVATWYVMDDDRILVNMDEGRKRLEYLRADPRVSITVLDENSWYTHVSIQGRAVEISADEGLAGIDRICRHYSGEPFSNRSRGAGQRLDRDRPLAWLGGAAQRGLSAGRARSASGRPVRNDYGSDQGRRLHSVATLLRPLEDRMIRERLHFTVKGGNGWNDALELIREIDEIQIAAGRATGTVWTQVVGPFNEMVIETDFADLATYERESEALMSDPAVLKLFPRFEEVTVEGKGYNELLMTAERMGG